MPFWCKSLETLNPTKVTQEMLRKEEENMANRTNSWNAYVKQIRSPRATRVVAMILLGFIALVLMFSLTSCSRQADRVSYNLPQEADNFNIRRKITIINLRTDTIIFEATGNFSVLKSGEDVDIVGENPDHTYYKHFVRLPQLVAYAVVDLGSTGVNRYAFEINFNPLMLFVATPDIID
jgi:hypothetical protein